MKEQPTDEYTQMVRYNLDEQAIMFLKAPLKELAGWYPLMPKVNEQGESECPFAESMFLKKFRLEQNVAERLAVLQEMRPVIEQEVERCRCIAYRASVDQERLDHLAGLDYCNEPLTNEECYFRCAVWRLKAITKAIQEAEDTLHASRKKTYPLPLSA